MSIPVKVFIQDDRVLASNKGANSSNDFFNRQGWDLVTRMECLEDNLDDMINAMDEYNLAQNQIMFNILKKKVEGSLLLFHYYIALQEDNSL
tara:strand:+ start:55 stop:330 length:276 start_codon:yes stop_codon:yes gene_type:complete